MKKLLSFFSLHRARLFFTFFFLVYSAFTQSQNIIDFAGNGNMGYSGDGFPANSGYCEMYQPTGVYVDKFGNTYISDCVNNIVRKVNTSGIISTFAGIRILSYGGYSGDGGPAINAELNEPDGISGDNSGNIYIADFDNGVIRMVNTSGIISTVAGSGYRGFSGDGGPATVAEMYLPIWVFIDTKENMYISEYGNSRIRIVNTSGIISTFAGNGGTSYNGDGGAATAAEIGFPIGVFGDSTGNIYITGESNVIRKVNSSDTISTIAGNGTSGYFGDGGIATSAELDFPAGMCFDATGNLLFCDGGNERVREINTLGIISTIAGSGNRGYYGDGGPATDAELSSPYGIAVNQYGNVCFADALNNVVREIVYNPTGIADLENNTSISIYPNPTTNKLLVILDRSPPQKVEITILDITGREVLKTLNNISQEKSVIDVSSLSAGIYFIAIHSNENIITRKFIKL